MQPIQMIQAGFMLLALGATGGLLTAGLSTHGPVRQLPPALDRMHGGLAACGLALMLLGVLIHGGVAMLQAATVLLLLAGLAGAWFNLRLHVRESPLPMGPVLVHGAVALLGLNILLKILLGLNQ